MISAPGTFDRRYIRINDKGYPVIWIGGKWVRVHVILWERYNGPEGYVLHHRDLDRSNYSLDNLELLTEGECCIAIERKLVSCCVKRAILARFPEVGDVYESTDPRDFKEGIGRRRVVVSGFSVDRSHAAVRNLVTDKRTWVNTRVLGTPTQGFRGWRLVERARSTTSALATSGRVKSTNKIEVDDLEAIMTEDVAAAHPPDSGGWSYGGDRHFHPDHWSKGGFTLHVVWRDHESGLKDEAIFTRTEELAREVTTALNNKAALRSPEANPSLSGAAEERARQMADAVQEAERETATVRNAVWRLDHWATEVVQRLPRGEYERLRAIQQGLPAEVKCQHEAECDVARGERDRLDSEWAKAEKRMVDDPDIPRCGDWYKCPCVKPIVHAGKHQCRHGDEWLDDSEVKK